MDQVKNSGFNKCLQYSGKNIAHTPEEDFVSRIYHFVDDAARRELLLLRTEKSIIPTCKPGCYQCCNQHILINRSEAHAIGQYIRREFSPEQTSELRLRTWQWHNWNDARPELHRLSGITAAADTPGGRPFCPLLVGGLCSVYPMRPITCRTHFVFSDPAFCRFSKKHPDVRTNPLSLSSVVTATNRFSKQLRDSINKTGSEFIHDIMLLPHWLAIEMDWDFALAV